MLTILKNNYIILACNVDMAIQEFLFMIQHCLDFIINHYIKERK